MQSQQFSGCFFLSWFIKCRIGLLLCHASEFRWLLDNNYLFFLLWKEVYVLTKTPILFRFCSCTTTEYTFRLNKYSFLFVFNHYWLNVFFNNQISMTEMAVGVCFCPFADQIIYIPYSSLLQQGISVSFGLNR